MQQKAAQLLSHTPPHLIYIILHAHLSRCHHTHQPNRPSNNHRADQLRRRRRRRRCGAACNTRWSRARTQWRRQPSLPAAWPAAAAAQADRRKGGGDGGWRPVICCCCSCWCSAVAAARARSRRQQQSSNQRRQHHRWIMKTSTQSFSQTAHPIRTGRRSAWCSAGASPDRCAECAWMGKGRGWCWGQQAAKWGLAAALRPSQNGPACKQQVALVVDCAFSSSLHRRPPPPSSPTPQPRSPHACRCRC